jgi:hypothetical protein
MDKWICMNCIGTPCRFGSIQLGGKCDKCQNENVTLYPSKEDFGQKIIPDVKPLDTIIKKKELINRVELIETIEEMIKRSDDMPRDAMIMPLNHYDLHSLLLLLLSILRLH